MVEAESLQFIILFFLACVHLVIEWSDFPPSEHVSPEKNTS